MIVPRPNHLEQGYDGITVPTVRTITVGVPEVDGKVAMPRKVPFGFGQRELPDWGEGNWTDRDLREAT